METTVITFDITSSFENWVNAYDESLPKQEEFGLVSLYRGHEKDDPTKCIVIVSAGEGHQINSWRRMLRWLQPQAMLWRAQF